MKTASMLVKWLLYQLGSLEDIERTPPYQKVCEGKNNAQKRRARPGKGELIKKK